MPSNPTVVFAAVVSRLAPNADEAQHMVDHGGPAARTVGRAVLAAIRAGRADTQAGCGAFLAALAPAAGEATRLAKTGNDRQRQVSTALLAAQRDAAAVVWAKPALGRVTIAAGPGDVQSVAGRPTKVSVALRRDGDLAAAASCGWAFTGLAPAPLVDIAVFPAGGTASVAAVTVPAQPGVVDPLPFEFAVQAPFVGLDPTPPPPAQGRLLPPVVVPARSVVSVAQGFDAVVLSASAPTTGQAVLSRTGGTDALEVPVVVAGLQDGDLAAPVAPARFAAGAPQAAVTIQINPGTAGAPDRAAHLAIDASGGAFDLGSPAGFDFAVREPAVVVPPPSSATSGMTPNNSDMAVDQVDAVSAWRGAPVSCYTVFNFGHTGWPQFVASYTKPGWAPFRVVPILARKGVVPILTIPGLVVGGNDFDAAERGDYDHYHQGMADWLAAQPWTTEVVLRLSRESNDPNQPFFYGHDTATRKRWAAIHTRIFGIYQRALGDRARWSFCVMKRADGWQDAYPEACHIVDIDAYLNTPVVHTQADFDKHWSVIQPHIDFAVQKGKPVAFSEWAIKDVEMPLGIKLQTEQYKKLAAAGRLHHENYFNSTPNHAIFGSTNFPLSAAAYVAAYRTAA